MSKVICSCKKGEKVWKKGFSSILEKTVIPMRSDRSTQNNRSIYNDILQSLQIEMIWFHQIPMPRSYFDGTHEKVSLFSYQINQSIKIYVMVMKYYFCCHIVKEVIQDFWQARSQFNSKVHDRHQRAELFVLFRTTY